LTVRDLQLRVLVVAEQLGERCPKGKSWGYRLEWLHINWRKEKLWCLGNFLVRPS
jgi:hypothetical protein